MEKTAERIEEPLLQSLIEVAKQLSRAIHLRSFYPKGHRAIGSSLDELKEALDSILRERGEVTIGSTGGALVYEGIPFGDDKKPVRDLARHMKVRDMSGVTFKSGASRSDLESAVEILSLSPEALASPESPALEALSEHVELRRIRYDKVIRHVSEEQAGAFPQNDISEVWRSVIIDDLYGHGSDLSDAARSMIAGSAADRASFRRMTGALLEAGEEFDGDKTAFVAKGLARTCEGLAGMRGDLRENGVKFLSEELQNVDSEVTLRLLGDQGDSDSTEGQALLSEAAQSLPVEVKLSLLAASVRAHKADSSRMSSVFRRLAGAEKRRRDLLAAIESEARRCSDRGEDRFQDLISAVRELVISERDAKFVGSSYVSMLEQLGEEGGSSEVDLDGESTRLEEFRRSLEPAKLAVSKVQFLTDLARLQADVGMMESTLEELESTCRQLREERDFEPSVEAVCRLLDHQTRLDGKEPEKAEALRKCLRSLFTEDTARLVIERLASEGVAGRLRAALEAVEYRAIEPVCDYATHEKGALENKEICNYLAAHAESAADHCAERLKACAAHQCKRLLDLLARLDTPRAIGHIESALEHPEHRVRVEAVRTLAQTGSTRANEVLQRLLAAGDRRMAMEAATALGEARSQGAADLLLASMRRLDLFGRRILETQQVVKALGRLRAPGAVPSLEAMLRKRTWATPKSKRELRETVARCLLAIGSDEALAALNRGVSCRNRQVREICYGALELRGRAAGRRKVGERPGDDGLSE